jgi:DNA polymerase-3 subunit alpha
MEEALHPKFVHLHLHSHYSLLDGLSKVSEIVAKAKEHGSGAVAITDHGVMYGAIDLYQECKKAGIKPIIGFEAYIINGDISEKTASTREKSYHLTLLAKNEAGYKNLMKLVTVAHLEGYYYKPRINKELLKAHSEGVICFSGCMAAEVGRLILDGQMPQAREAISWYRELFGEDYYLEVQYHPNLPDQVRLNEEIKKLSQEFNIPMVLTTDSHYVTKEDADAQDILACVQTGAVVTDAKRFSMQGELFDIQSPKELLEYYKNDALMLGAIAETVKIADKVNFEMALGGMILPKFEIPEGETFSTFLRKKVTQGLSDRYGEISPEINTRAEYELSIIEQMGYESYFLIVADYINWAKDNGIAVGPGRGSVAGSIIAFALKITGVDPLEHNLLFERFLNPERISMPDIDVDFADDRRDEVIEYVTNKYGKDHVAQIITFGTMASRAAVRDVGRALGMPYADVDKVAKVVPPPVQGKHVPLKKILHYDPSRDHFDPNDLIGQSIKGADELRAIYAAGGKARELLDLAQKLEGTVRHTSVHAAGVVIGDKPLVNYTPLQMSTTAGKTAIVTQYGMYPVEAIGLLKMDFLGLRNLSIIQNALRILRKTKDIDIDIEKIPLDDAKTFELLAKGLTVGVFQFESDGMKRYLKELQPSVLEDLIAMAALYRPGPMNSIPDFIAAKHGRKQVEYLDPSFEPILRPTYGIITYQEQVFEIARVFAGFTYGQADILRKAMGKKIRSLMEEQKEKFVESAVTNGKDRVLAERVWSFVEPFAEYGFNKSHSACYGLIAYQTAYLKANFPAEFMAAVLTADQDHMDKISKNLAEAENLGLAVLPPSVNESFTDFAVVRETGNIRFGLNAIKNVGRKISDLIVSAREEGGPFKSLTDFASRADKDALNKKTLESLIKAGALDDFGERNQMLAGMDRIAGAGNRDKNQLDIFGQAQVEAVTSIDLPDVEAASEPEKLVWEKELLGTFVSRHPLEDFKEILQNKFLPLSKLQSKSDNSRVTVAGMITRLQKISTRSGEPMFFAKLEDLDTTIELVVFPKVAKDLDGLLAADQLVIAHGRTNVKDRVVQTDEEISVESEVKVLVESLEPLTHETVNNMDDRPEPLEARAEDPALKPQFKVEDGVAVLHIPEGFNNGKLLTLKHLMESFRGDTPLILEIMHNGSWQRVETSTKVKVTPELESKIKDLA